MYLLLRGNYVINNDSIYLQSNYAVYGVVIFHAADILPGYLTEAFGPITSPYKVIQTLEKYQ